MKSSRTSIVPTAKDINEAHRLARSSAETAVEHAIRCGQMLAAKKAELRHGEFQQWVEKNCEFSYSTCSRYMKAGQNSHAVEISSLRHLFPSGQPGHKSAPQTVRNSPSGAVPVVNPKGTVETGADRPAAPVSEKPQEPELNDEWEPTENEEECIAQAEQEYAASIDKVMEADDKLAVAHSEIKRQAAEIASLKLSRDGFQNRCTEILRRYKQAQRTIEKLEKQLGKKAA